MFLSERFYIQLQIFVEFVGAFGVAFLSIFLNPMYIYLKISFEFVGAFGVSFLSKSLKPLYINLQIILSKSLNF